MSRRHRARPTSRGHVAGNRVRPWRIGLQHSKQRCYYIYVRGFLTFLMMVTLTVANGTALAAATCQHQDAVGHVAALEDDDAQIAAIAQMEDTAGSVASKQGALADSGSSSLPVFLMPGSSAILTAATRGPVPALPKDEAKLAGRSVAPLLEPPAA